MTRVCLVGEDDSNLQYELLSRETSREALSTYDLGQPYANTVALETISLGAAVSLLNDLNWYLIRFVADAFVREPSVSETEWLSRDLAAAVRDGDLEPAETARFLKVYGVQTEAATPAEDGTAGTEAVAAEPAAGGPPRLVEPMYVARTGGAIPEYDLRDVEETLVVRVTEAEFGP